jgi:hypothetical protein
MRGGALRRDAKTAREWQARSRKPLARTELKRSRPRPKPASEVMNAAVCAEVSRRQHGVCICGCGGRIAPFPIGHHHILSKARWPHLTNEPDDIVGVTADCHANHENASKRLPRAACALAERLATTPPMQSYLDRTYGPLATTAPAATSRDTTGRSA